MLMRSLEQLGNEIEMLSVHLDAATVHLLDLIREFDIRGLEPRLPLVRRVARLACRPRQGRRARACPRRPSSQELPRLKTALAHGELSYAKVRALTRVATAAMEERLLAIGRAGTAEHVERIVRGWRRVDRKAEVEETSQPTSIGPCMCIGMWTVTWLSVGG